jgi:hypothetical protein
MSEWWSYRLSDFLLFSPRTYYRLFELYNEALWPAQLAAAAIGLAILVLLLRPAPARSRAAAALLALCWLFVAIAFHLQRYATINWAAVWFAAGFALEAALLLAIGAIGGGLAPRAATGQARRIGVGFFLFALVLQPLIGPALGRAWPQIELFGLAPDPTAVATLGVALFATGRARWALLAVPLAWCLVGGATLWTMAAPDAALLPLAGLVAVLAATASDRVTPA